MATHSIFPDAGLVGYTRSADSSAITVATNFFVQGGQDGWTVQGLRVWIDAAESGDLTGAWGLLFSQTPAGGTQTFLAAKQFPGALTPGEWNELLFDTPVAVSEYPGGAYYQAAAYLPHGNYVALARVFDPTTGPNTATGGVVTSPTTPDLKGASASDFETAGQPPGNGVFRAGTIADPSAPGTIAWSQFAATHYGVDVIVADPDGAGGGVAPSSTVAPAVTGTGVSGSALTGGNGTWAGDTPITFTRQWQVSADGGSTWTDISGATGTTFTPDASYETKKVREVVSATNTAGGPTTANSSAVTITTPTGGGGDTGGGASSGANARMSVLVDGAWQQLQFAGGDPQQLNRFYPENYGAVGDGVTDDTQAIRDCVNAAVAAGIADGSNYAEIAFSVREYLLDSAAVVGGATAGNAQIPLPVIPETDMKFTLALVGTRNASTWNHWLQTAGQSNGARLRTTMAGVTPDATYGPPAVIGGPTANLAGAGIAAGFSNMLVVVDGLQIVGPTNPCFIGINLLHVAQADIKSYSAQADATSTFLHDHPATDDQGIGLALPALNNNDNVTIGSLSVMGFYWGCNLVDHLAAVRMGFVYCHTALYLAVGGGAYHGASILNLSVEATSTAIEVINSDESSKFPLFVGMVNIETDGGTNFIDPDDALRGIINFTNNTGAAPTKTGATAITINDLFAA